MILDKTNEFSDSQTVTASAISINVIDLNPDNANPIVDIGSGEPVELIVQVDATAAAAGAATVAVALESSATANMASPTVHVTSGSLSLDRLTAGSQVLRVRLPAGDYKRYLGVRYTVATGPLTAGAFSAFIVKDGQSQRTYKSGWTV